MNEIVGHACFVIDTSKLQINMSARFWVLCLLFLCYLSVSGEWRQLHG